MEKDSNKPIYIQPSIYLSLEDQIAYNEAYLVELKEWYAKQIPAE